MKEEFRRTNEELDQESPEKRQAFGERIRQLRKAQRLSIRDVAERTDLDKNTILRVEHGLGVRESTRLKLCDLFGVLRFPVGASSSPTELGTHYAKHLPELESWFRLQLKDAQDPSDLIDSVDIQQRGERQRLGSLGFATQFVKRLGIDRPNANLRAAIFEVYGSSGWSRQTSGEAFVFVLRGAIRFHVGSETFILEEGGAAVFDRRADHMHEPLAPTARGELPPLLLYLQSDFPYPETGPARHNRASS